MRQRLDLLLVERGLFPTREKARAMIMAGRVLIKGAVADKPGTTVPQDAEVEVRRPAVEFVGRGGTKLASALLAFAIDPAGMTVLDVGASTGGFTDCLLRGGAAHVYAVDVGYGQLDAGLRNDPRVTVMERENIRHLARERIPGEIDLAVVDTSFISLRLVLPPTAAFIREGGAIVALVKPQFELGPREVGKGGVVRDEEKRQQALQGVSEFAASVGLEVAGTCRSPITGAKGNVEFFIHLKKGAGHGAAG